MSIRVVSIRKQSNVPAGKWSNYKALHAATFRPRSGLLGRGDHGEQGDKFAPKGGHVPHLFELRSREVIVVDCCRSEQIDLVPFMERCAPCRSRSAILLSVEMRIWHISEIQSSLT
jgi:hypothetical protein